MTAIYKREVKSYFHSMVGYVFIAFLVAFTGIYFMAFNLNKGYPYFSYVLSATQFIFLIAVPILTMRSFAEEKKNKTDQLFLTAPVSLGRIVIGKYLAMITILAVPCVIYLIFPLIIRTQGTAYILVDYLSILVFFLMGCVYIAIGMFVSSLTDSTAIAAIGAFGILILLHLWDGLLNFLPSAAWANMMGIVLLASLTAAGMWQMTGSRGIGAVTEVVLLTAAGGIYLVKPAVFENALKGILGRFRLAEAFSSISSNRLLDVSGIILYLTLIGLFIFLTMQMIQKRRWS